VFELAFLTVLLDGSVCVVCHGEVLVLLAWGTHAVEKPP